MVKALMLFVSICLMKETLGAGDEDIEEHSKTLWTSSGWTANEDISFTDCNVLANTGAKGEHPSFCSKTEMQIHETSWSKPFIEAFTSLLDVYDIVAPVGVEATSINTFLDEFIKTQTGITLHGLMVEPKKVKEDALTRLIRMMLKNTNVESAEVVNQEDVEELDTDPVVDTTLQSLDQAQHDSFKADLKTIWFGDTTKGTSRTIGFRHVFVGDKPPISPKKKTLSGFHSWYQFDRKLCKSANAKVNEIFPFDYIYVGEVGGTQPNHVRFCNIKPIWNGYKKKKPSTILFGSRPEYDFAVFTYCFFKRKGAKTTKGVGGKCNIEVDGAKRKISVLGKSAVPADGGSKLTTAYFT